MEQPRHSRYGRARAGRTCGPAFTLIEVLVVAAVIALLVAVLLPALGAARVRARTVACAANLRTAGTGLVYYTEANNGYYCEAAHWAYFAHIYVQRRSADLQYTGPERFADGRDVQVSFYNCPGDELRHEETGKRKVNGQTILFNYRLSYALSSYLVNQLYDPVAAAEKGYYGLGNLRMKASQVARPAEIVALTDAGNDNVSQLDEMHWDFDIAWDPGSEGWAVLEVHHRSGNNFLLADGHVAFQPILAQSAWHRGVPRFPSQWVPLLRLGRPAPID